MQHIGDFNFPRLADFGAAISGANKLQCQEVLEELDVSRYLIESFKDFGRYFGLIDIHRFSYVLTAKRLIFFTDMIVWKWKL